MPIYTIDDISMSEGRVRASVSVGDGYFYCETLPVRGMFTGAINVAATQRALIAEFKRRRMERAAQVAQRDADDVALAQVSGTYREA